MKREIIFRGKDTNNGEWVYGDLIQLDTQLCIAEAHQWAGVPANNSIEIDVIEVAPETVGQFTGLLDKNGVEIYEGDIVEFTRAQCRGVHRGTRMSVSYQTYCFCGFGFDETMALTKRRAKECFVVGSIHNNPESIKAI